MKLKLRMLAALAGVPVLVAAPLIACSTKKATTELTTEQKNAVEKVKTALATITLADNMADVSEAKVKEAITKMVDANQDVIDAKQKEVIVELAFSEYKAPVGEGKEASINVVVNIKVANNIVDTIASQTVKATKS